MSENELDEIRDRANGATPAAEWECRKFEDVWEVGPDGGPGHAESHAAVVKTMEPYNADEWSPISSQVSEDAYFIQHARTDIPKLLDEIARLKSK